MDLTRIYLKPIKYCTCNKKSSFISFKKGYKQYCSNKCANNSTTSKKKFRQTKLEKYGSETYNNSDKMHKSKSEKDSYGLSGYYKQKESTKITNLEKYGVEYVLQSTIVKTKSKATKLKLYDDVNYNNIELRKQNNLIKYGVDEYVKTKVTKGIIKSDNDLALLEIYKKEVAKVTYKQNIELLDNFELRGKSNISGTYQLDHKFSIAEGFEQSILPLYIGNIYNLEMIPSLENASKGKKCSITMKTSKGSP